MISIAPFVRGVVPVNSFSRERTPVVPPVPQPEIGLRWGKTADLSLSSESQTPPPWRNMLQSQGGAEPETPTFNVLVQATMSPSYQPVAVEDSGLKVRMRRMANLAFDYKEKLDQHTSSSWFYLYWSYYFEFDLHPDNESQE